MLGNIASCLVITNFAFQKAWELKSRLDGLHIPCYREIVQGVDGHPCFSGLVEGPRKKSGFLGGDSWCILAIPVGLEIPNGKYFNLGIKTHGKH